MHNLDIILTHYNEPVSVVVRFLESLKAQSLKNLKVTIVDDGFGCPELAIDRMRYPFEVCHLKKEHKTISAARNFGLDNTTAPYLMFCDCDDMFDDRNLYGLEHAISKVLMKDLCVYRSLYCAEVWKNNIGNLFSALYKADENDELILVPQKQINAATVHSKIYQRKFIDEYKIRFLDDLWMNEDGVFNEFAFDVCRAKNLKWLDDNEMFYIYKFNRNSVTRMNNIYPVKGYDQFIKSFIYRFKNERDLGIDIGCREMAMFIFQAYYWLYLYSDRFIGMPEYAEYMTADMIEVKKLLIMYIPLMPEGIFNDHKIVNYRKSFMNRLDKCDMTKKISLEEWIEKAMK